MTYSINLLEDGNIPVYILRIWDTFDYQQCEDVWDTIDEYISNREHHHIFWIMDLSQIVMPEADLIKMIQNSYHQRPGTVTDYRLTPIVIARDSFDGYLRRLTKQLGYSVMIPLFPTVYEALEFIAVSFG